MLLFRRRSRDKDAGADDRAETAATPAPSAGTPEAPAGPSPEPAPPAPARVGSPPPLPQRLSGGAATPALAPLSRCFVCGSALEAGRCPVCRIAWVE